MPVISPDTYLQTTKIYNFVRHEGKYKVNGKISF